MIVSDPNTLPLVLREVIHHISVTVEHDPVETPPLEESEQTGHDHKVGVQLVGAEQETLFALHADQLASFDLGWDDFASLLRGEMGRTDDSHRLYENGHGHSSSPK